MASSRFQKCIPISRGNLSASLVERVTRKFWEHMVFKDEWPMTKERLERYFKDEFLPVLRNFEEKRVRFCHALGCLYKLNLIQTPSSESADLIAYSYFCSGDSSGEESEDVLEGNASEENVFVDNATEENVLYYNATEENVSVDNALGENVLYDNAMEENVFEKNASGENVPYDNAMEENVSEDNTFEEDEAVEDMLDGKVSESNVLQVSVSEEDENVSEDDGNESEEDANVSEEDANVSEEYANVSEDDDNESDEDANMSEEYANESDKDANVSEEDANVSEDDDNESDKDANVSEEDAKVSEDDANESDEDANVSEEDANVSEKDALEESKSEEVADESSDDVQEVDVPQENVLEEYVAKGSVPQMKAPAGNGQKGCLQEMFASGMNVSVESALERRVPIQNLFKENFLEWNVMGINTPKKDALEESVPKATGPGENVPEKTVAEENAPEENAQEENAPEENAPEGNAPEENALDDTILKETVPEENVPEMTIPEESVPEANIPEMKLAEERESVTASGTRVEAEEKAVKSKPCDWLKMKRNILRNRDALVKDKYGVKILSRFDSANGLVNFGVFNVGDTITVPILIRNTNNYFLDVCCTMLGSAGNYNIRDRYGMSRGQRLRLPATKKALISMTFKTDNPGTFKMPVAFVFRHGDLEFNVLRFFVAEATDDLIVSLAPVSPYAPPKKIEEDNEKLNLIPGPPPPRPPSDFAVPLKSYRIPEYLLNYVDAQTDEELQSQLNEPLTLKNHHSKLSLLLHIDEVKMTTNIRHFDLHQVHMLPSGQYLALEIPGLSENRPSLLRGDFLYARLVDSEGTPGDEEYQGYIHHVCRNEVLLKFHDRIHRQFSKQMLFRIRFTVNRTPIRLKHRALSLAFPFLSKGIYSYPHGQEHQYLRQTGLETLQSRFFDSKILTNKEQKQAVENIVAGTSRPLPYIVFGPPGTGKTVTLTEAIKQVLFSLPNSRVLACAPSNSAADLILERVVEHDVIPKKQIIRMNAFGRSHRSVDPKLLKYCVVGKDKEFCIPQKHELMRRYRLVVTTLVTAGRLVTMGVPETHFTHVFIDEASQASEPEVLVPIAGLFTPSNPEGGQLVLAGDPKQLGPIIYSTLAESCGLNISFLERLMSPEFPCYNKRLCEPYLFTTSGVYDSCFITKLLNNYRSHPALLKIPNDLFYHGELRACADKLERNSMCTWESLPSKGFPVVFEGVCGVDQREDTSPSFFNPHEISVVVRCVHELKYARNLRVDLADIGIISPYYKQVKKIRSTLDRVNLHDVKVGSVEEFQGQEKNVIIISTVRSSQEYLQWDAKYKLGFLKNPKRFNVAVTRAKSLLIVVGNPHVLCEDPYWRRLLQYCLQNNSYKGCAFNLSQEEDTDISNIIAQLDTSNLGAKTVFDRRELQRPGDESDDRVWERAEYY